MGKILSHQPFHHNHGLKHTQKKGLDGKPSGKDGRKVNGQDYLSDCKKTRLPHGFRGVIA